jgi:hypothetical protein
MTTRRQEKRQSNLLIRLLLVVVFSGGYLALAVLGRGGIGALFALFRSAPVPRRKGSFGCCATRAKKNKMFRYNKPRPVARDKHIISRLDRRDLETMGRYI